MSYEERWVECSKIQYEPMRATVTIDDTNSQSHSYDDVELIRVSDSDTIFERISNKGAFVLTQGQNLANGEYEVVFIDGARLRQPIVVAAGKSIPHPFGFALYQPQDVDFYIVESWLQPRQWAATKRSNNHTYFCHRPTNVWYHWVPGFGCICYRKVPPQLLSVLPQLISSGHLQQVEFWELEELAQDMFRFGKYTL